MVLLEPTATLRQQMNQAQHGDDKEALYKLREATLDQIWPTIEELHLTTPPAVRFDRSRVIFTDADRPMLLTAKGTVRRRMTVERYAEQIEAVQGIVKKVTYCVYWSVAKQK